MPTYQYECKKCKKVFDYFQKMSDNPITQCIHCKTGAVRRLIGSGAGIIFKGSGFYETDYKQKRGKAPEATKNKVSPTEKSLASKTETKKTESKSKGD